VGGRPRREPRDGIDDTLVDVCEQTVREARCCLLARLGDQPLSTRARQLLADAMVARGLERVGTKVRVPVREQIATLVSSEPILVNGLKRRLVGCTDREIKTALGQGQDAWSLVQRGKSLAVVARSEAVLSESELAELASVTSEFAALAKSVKPKRGGAPTSLWRADVVALFDRGAALRTAAPPIKEDIGSVTERVLQGLAQAADRQTGLASVPHVLRSLLPAVPSDQAHDALVALASAGRIELRPESGVELLAPELRALCPPGPRGSVLSYARVLSTSGPGSLR
jgi:hypothetical protein